VARVPFTRREVLLCLSQDEVCHFFTRLRLPETSSFFTPHVPSLHPFRVECPPRSSLQNRVDAQAPSCGIFAIPIPQDGSHSPPNLQSLLVSFFLYASATKHNNPLFFGSLDSNFSSQLQRAPGEGKPPALFPSESQPERLSTQLNGSRPLLYPPCLCTFSPTSAVAAPREVVILDRPLKHQDRASRREEFRPPPNMLSPIVFQLFTFCVSSDLRLPVQGFALISCRLSS